MKKSKILINLGNKIRQCRKKCGLSQEELAVLAKLDRTYIGGIERGERNPSVLSLEKVSKALNMGLSNFFER